MAQDKSFRTIEELKKSEFNYFIAFKVELNETDSSKIETKIKTITSDPKGGIYSRRLLELKNDALEIMCKDSIYDENQNKYIQNAGGRKKEAEIAKKFKLDEAIGITEILCQTRKELMKSELIDICNTTNKPIVYFTEKEFFDSIKYLEGLGVKIIDNIDNQIPFSDYIQAEKYLKSMDKSTLYEFLELSSTASNADIQNAHDTLYKSTGKISDLKKKQLIGTLCGIVKKILLLNPQSRKNYDNYLVLREEVWYDFEKRKSFGIKELQIDEYKDYTEKVIQLLKTNINEAEKIIAIGCKYFQLRIVGKTDGNNLEYCPYDDCNKLFVKGVKNCPHCGKSLEILCWNCGHMIRFTKDDVPCSGCGATHGAHELYLTKCRDMDALLLKQEININDLQTTLLGLKNVIPNYEKVNDSVINKKIQEYDDIVQKKIREEETIGKKYKEDVSKINELISQKKYQGASNLISNLQHTYKSYNIQNTQKLANTVASVLKQVEQNIELAKRYLAQNNEKFAIQYAAKAVEECVDYSEANVIFQKFPPKPVVNVRTKVNENKVIIEWNDNYQQEYVTYSIVKKIGVVPTSHDDGALVDNGLTIKYYEDENIVSANPYYYAVYTERFGVRSSLVCDSSPVMIFSDVANLEQEIVQNGIKVSFESPQNVKNIEVWKNVGNVAPSDIGEGTKIQCDLKGFNDNSCLVESAYLVKCAYQVKGQIVYSKGVKIVCKPFESVKPLENISIDHIEGNKFVLKCEEDFVGNIGIYYSTTKLNLKYNEVLKYIDFNAICKGLMKLNYVLNSDGNRVFNVPQGNVYQVYPIVFTEQLFVVSNPVLINTIKGIDCEVKVEQGKVIVEGNLHQRANSIVVKISHKQFPTTVNDDGEKLVYKKDIFNQSNKLEFKLKTNTINYISIFVEIIADNVSSYCQPFKLPEPIDYREPVDVLYCIEYKVSTTKAFKVSITFESDKETEIPKMLLVKGSPRPMNKNSGELCDNIGPFILKKGLFSSKYKAKCEVKVDPSSLNTKFAIFVNDGGEHVRLKEVRDL